MSMRLQLAQTTLDLLRSDEKVVVILGDVGTYGLRECFKEFPDRIYNIGILEQAMIGVAAGMSAAGLIPIVHSFAPFLTERCLEQIKLDFGYQELGGTFISVGGSYDYTKFGSTHHCPADVKVMTSIPNLEVVVPGTGEEFDSLMKATYNNNRPTYIRLSEHGNAASQPVEPGLMTVVQQGNLATVVAVGPMLEPVLQAAAGLDVTIVYYTTVSPFDGSQLSKFKSSSKILVCEPYYRGALTTDITDAMWPRPALVKNVGMPRQFVEHYGSKAQLDDFFGLNAEALRKELESLIAV